MTDQANTKTKGARVRILYAFVLIILAANVALAYTAWRRTQQQMAVRLIPGIESEKILKANAPTQQMLRTFAAHYLMTQESYTPSTIRRVHEILLGWITPERYGEAKAYFEKRAQAVVDGQISASIVLHDWNKAEIEQVSERSWRMRIRGLRRTYMGREFIAENELVFVVVIELGSPTAVNPHALYITGASSLPIEKEPSR